MDEKLKQRLIRTRKAVKKKLQSLKEGEIKKEYELEKSYAPVTKKLRELSSKLYDVGDIKDENLKIEPKIEETENRPFSSTDAEVLVEKIPSFLDTSVITQSEPEPEPAAEDDLDLTRDITHSMSNEAWNEYLDQYDPLPRHYIEGLFLDRDKDYDSTTVVKHDPIVDKFKLGNADVNFEGKDLIIDGKKYDGTPGLYELIFKKQPLGFKMVDRDNYAEILNRTNVHRLNYDPESRARGNRSTKYKNIIKPITSSGAQTGGGLFMCPNENRKYENLHDVDELVMRLNRIIEARNAGNHRVHHRNEISAIIEDFKRIVKRNTSSRVQTGGELFMNFNENPINYVYFNDINELVTRLRLILASKAAGNNSHNNEFVSIIEELKEADLII